MALLEQHFEKLRSVFPTASIEKRSDGSALISIPDFQLKPGWNRPSTTIIFVAPVGYPLARPDTFWADADLLLQHGGMPANSSINANYGGVAPKLWFSFHPNSWNPSLDDMLTYTRLIQRRLADAR